MKQKMKLLGLSVLSASLLFVSCAQDGFDEESFESSVTNTQMTSPNAEDVKTASSADGSQWIVSWPLVKGASSFQCTVTNVTDPVNPVILFTDSIIDGCTLTFPREDDSNYVLDIRTLGNKSVGNTDAEEATKKSFTSFLPTWKEIPAETDISTWLAHNPIPADITDEVCIDLVPGANYTMTSSLDFGTHRVTLRSTTPTQPAIIKIVGDASFIIDEGFTMKNLNIDASGSASHMIVGNKTPAEVNVEGGYYRVENPIYIKNVKINGLQKRFIHDGNVKYCFKTVIIDDCIIEHTPTEKIQFIRMESGFVNDLTIRNSTIWNAGEVSQDYIVQYQNAGRSTRAGYISNSITVSNCTFYNMAKTEKFGNYDGFKGQECSYFTLTNSILMNTGGKQIIQRFSGNGKPKPENAKFSNNTLFNYDMDIIEENYPTELQVLGDPQFTNPTEGDFHISGPAAAAGIGDPRWL